MKKIYWSFLTVFSLLAFAACSDDDGSGVNNGKTGDLITTIRFASDDSSEKAVGSNARPITNWNSINQVQMFIYKDATGEIVYSYVMDPRNEPDYSPGVKKFTWSNIPEGSGYRIGLIANARSTSDDIYTTVSGGSTLDLWTGASVLGKTINTEVFMDLKEGTFVDWYQQAPQTSSLQAYVPASDVFSAYSTGLINITEGGLQDAGTFKLEREISLMRVRVDRTYLDDLLVNEDGWNANDLSKLDFNANGKSTVMVFHNPEKMGLLLNTFKGGIFDATTNKNRVVVGGKGTTTFETADPSTSNYENVSGIGSVNIIDNEFTLWNDIRIFPNMSRAEAIANPSDTALVESKYAIVIYALAPVGYKFDDPTKPATTQPTPVYWTGTVHGIFEPNTIREVNVRVKTRGSDDTLVEIPKVGYLEIEMSTPEPWNPVIKESELDV